MNVEHNYNENLLRTDGEALRSYGERMRAHIEKLDWQSGGHRTWYTHRNPAGCWICEALFIARQLCDEILDKSRDAKIENHETNRDRSEKSAV